MAYIGKSPSRGVRNRFQYQATASQTSFSGADANGLTLTYTDSLYMDVYQNGILLVPGDDYTATTGTTVVLVQAASLNDIVEMVVYDVFSVNDSVSASSGGTFSSAVTFGGGVVVADGGNIGSASDTDAISISSGGVVTLSQSSQNAQTFRLDHDVSGTANLQMFEDFEEADTDYTRVGSANWTVSSGAFSCATTGTYLCLYGISLTAASGGDEFDFNIEISTNSGGSFSVRSQTMCFVTGGQKSSVSNAFIFTVSDASAFRLRMTAGNSNNIASGSTALGSSTQHETGLTFVKLGVI